MTEQQELPRAFVMPDWMRQIEAEGCFQNTGGGYTVEELVNMTTDQTRPNVFLAAMLVSVSSQVTLLERLHAKGFLHGSMQELQRDIGTWAEETFPDQTDLTIVDHLQEEAAELWHVAQASEHKPGGVPLSDFEDGIADVLILVLCLAHRLSIDPSRVVAAKMDTNRKRTWELDPVRGYHRHVG
jgi:NTP pyrophosphatase (non-canonical NTP hydrolase)